jgi:hypothetical protein
MRKKKEKLRCIKNLKLCEANPEQAEWFGEKAIAQMKHDLANKFKDIMKRVTDQDEIDRYHARLAKLKKRSSLKHKMYRSAVKKAVKFKGKQKKALQKERVKQAKEDEDLFDWFGNAR